MKRDSPPSDKIILQNIYLNNYHDIVAYPTDTRLYEQIAFHIN